MSILFSGYYIKVFADTNTLYLQDNSYDQRIERVKPTTSTSFSKLTEDRAGEDKKVEKEQYLVDGKIIVVL
jgi:hypothetical protein